MQGRCSLVLRRRLCTGGAAEAGRLVYTTDWLRTVTLNCDKLNVRLQPHIVNEVQIGLETADGHPLPPASVAIKGPDGPTDDMDVITLTVASADCPPDADTIALYVPQRFHVDVTADGGSITQYDLLEGNTSLTAINGNVKAKKVRGAPSVSLRAEGGAVVANIIEGEATLVATRGGSVQAKRVSGPVVNVTVEGGGDLDLASSYGGVVRLATDSCGNITVDAVHNVWEGDTQIVTQGGSVKAGGVEGCVTINSNGGEVQVDIASKMHEDGVRVDTAGGQARLTVPKDLSIQLSADSSCSERPGAISVMDQVKDTADSCDISPDFDKYELSLNGGGPSVSINSAGGSIVVEHGLEWSFLDKMRAMSERRKTGPTTSGA